MRDVLVSGLLVSGGLVVAIGLGMIWLPLGVIGVGVLIALLAVVVAGPAEARRR